MVETATELVRRRQGRQQRKRTKLTSPTAISSNQQARVSAEENIDDAIARLEAELANDDGDSDDSSSVTSEPSNSDVEHTKTDQVGSGKLPEPTKGMVCLSALKDDRIESLPSQFLPAVPKRDVRRKALLLPIGKEPSDSSNKVNVVVWQRQFRRFWVDTLRGRQRNCHFIAVSARSNIQTRTSSLNIELQNFIKQLRRLNGKHPIVNYVENN